MGLEGVNMGLKGVNKGTNGARGDLTFEINVSVKIMNSRISKIAVAK